MKIELPEFCLVVVKGAQHQALEAFVHRHFGPGARVDTVDALRRQLRDRHLAVVVEAGAAGGVPQADALKCAKRQYAAAYAIDLSHHLADGAAPSHGDKQHRFKSVFEVPREAAAEEVEIALHKVQGDHRDVQGAFDIIGDVHGCCDELETLLGKLGYGVSWGSGPDRDVVLSPPPGRRLMFVGDLVDRGPRTPDVLRIAMAAVAQGAGFCVPGNHDTKFLRWLNGADVKLNHGLELSASQMRQESDAFHDRVRAFIGGLDVYFWCDGGRLLVAHAGIKEEYIGRFSKRVRRFCLYGDTSGEKDEAGLPVRYHWAAGYGGDAAVVYGHTPLPDTGWVNNTLCVDTGCCFGGALTALRWPERETVSVPALQTYTQRRRPFGHPPVRPAN
ncbi:MAG: hypothetical protein RLZ98_2855 [Pseudomonadota bacterium]|jgi:protein phosphatase